MTYEEFNVGHLSVHSGDILARQPVAGFLRYISAEAVEQGLISTLQFGLFPVVLQPKGKYTTLNEALTNTSISPTYEG